MVIPKILKNKYTLFLFIASAVVLVAAFSIAYVSIWDVSNLLVIHFDSFKGIDFLGSSSDIIDILVISFIIWLINIILANEFYYREKFLSYAIATLTLVYMILILVAINVIISTN